MITHGLIQTKFHYLPESLAVVLIGKIYCGVMKGSNSNKMFYTRRNLQRRNNVNGGVIRNTT